MDLLLELKRLFQDLNNDKIEEKEHTLEDLEKIADQCVKGNYKAIDQYLKPILSAEKYNQYKERIDKIKEISEREKHL